MAFEHAAAHVERPSSASLSTIGRLIACIVVFSTHLTAEEAIFSHREYALTGRSYQQLWVWTPDGGLKALTNSPRDHQLPISCEEHGRSVLFNSELDGLRMTRWRLDRTSGSEHMIGEGIDFPARAANPPGAPATCDVRTAIRSPDGTRFACAVNGSTVLIADARSGATIVQIPIDLHYTTGEPYPPPEEYSWAPDSRSLLVGVYGENGSSSNLDAEDYFVLDLNTKTWTRAFFGTGGLWVTPRVILYVTARNLSPLTMTGKQRSVWTAHLTSYDPVSHSSRALTSDLSNDLDPVVCAK